MPEITPTRRTVIRTAAWSVPAVTVAAAAPAFATSPPGGEVTYQEVTKTFRFNPVILGTINTDPINNVIVNVTATVPANIPRGATAAPVQTTSSVTIPAGLAGTLAGLILGNPATVEATSKSTTKLSGAFVGESITNLVIPATPYVSGSPLELKASGAGVEGLTIPAGNATGPVTLTLAPPESQLTGRRADGTTTNATPYASTLSPIDGADYTLGTFTIS